ncbi:MAG: MBOAT family protein [Bacteroidia bacterium]|nr:MBOAT family protein [Bacteroidia bacterium]
MFNNFIHLLKYDPKDPILFNSAFFLFFLGVFILCYQLVYKNKLHRILLFTLFSLYFFYKACGVYVGLVVISAIVDFIISNRIYTERDQRKKKTFLIFSIIINLGLLFYFKYTDFFIEIINDLNDGHIEPLNLLLPIGISFYTFENLSYTIDVYRGQFKPVKSFWEYLFFLSFFPKLVMGPIVRASDFIPQISKDYNITAQDFAKGFFLIIAGLFKKVIISDFIYVNFVQYIFDDPLRHTGLECLLAVYGYAMVIYCDFSGYSDMAIGLAKWMGFDININFLSPYQSSTITEFWRRWHISLSNWLRDYLYFPLGGNRLGKPRQYVNLMLTMLIGGLWHGASWNFIIWGGLHGAALAFHKYKIEVINKKWKFFKWSWCAGRKTGIFFTFHFVCFAWIFFKANTIPDALKIISQITTNFDMASAAVLYENYKYVLWIMAFGYVIHFLPDQIESRINPYLSKLSPLQYAVLLTAFIWILIQVKTSEVMMPIYLQF